MSTGISVIIPVLHERDRINRLIEHLRQQESPVPLEIIVVDGSVSGDTLQAIDAHDIIKVHTGKGRGLQMNKGAQGAQGEILLFLHADTLLPDNGIRKIVNVMEKGQCMVGAFDLGIETDHWLVCLTQYTASIRSRITRLPYGDQAIFIRKDLFQTMGGYREIPLMEDVELMNRIKKAGRTICFIPDRVTTSGRRWNEEGPYYATFRNWLLITLYCMGASPSWLARFYRFTKNPAAARQGNPSG